MQAPLTLYAPAAARPLGLGRIGRGLACALFGHRLDNRAPAGATEVRRCSCGTAFLAEDGSESRLGHVLGCFFRHHAYERTGERDGHVEYMCVRCGHPLLFPAGQDSYAGLCGFTKRVRYLCNLLGHRVHTVTHRHGRSEYACGCGHSFLRERAGQTRVEHPAVCLFAGHFVRFLDRRGEWSEFVCRNCGHTFGVLSPLG